MKKIVLALGLLLFFGNPANADGSAFTPLNFSDTNYGSSSTAKSITIPSTSLQEEATGNGNIQNAISQLENAQVDIRNELLNCKTKYADIDAQYKLIKAERSSLKQQVRTIEKRIKELDKAKDKIKKNMI